MQRFCTLLWNLKRSIAEEVRLKRAKYIFVRIPFVVFDYVKLRVSNSKLDNLE